jgi:hypothetical protein
LTSYQVDKRLVLSVFGFFFVINLITTGAHFDWSDGVLTFLVVESMALKNSAKLHPDLPSISLLYGDSEAKERKSDVAHYSHRSLLLAAIAFPFYLVANILSISPVFLVAFLLNSLIIAFTSLVVFCFSLEIYCSRKIAFALSLIFTGCSFILPYNTSLFPQPLQALCIVSAAYFPYKSRDIDCAFVTPNSTSEDSAGSVSNARGKKGIYFASLGGLFLGLSVFAHPTSIIVIPGFIAYNIFSSLIHRKKKKIVIFLISLAVILVAIALSNYIRFGTFTEFGYYQYASWSWSKLGWIGLIGLWISPGAGLIVFFTPVVLLPLALKYMYRENRQLFFLILYVVFANWLYFGTLSYMDPISWSGGLAWGPRYLVPVLPFITMALGTLLTRLSNSKQKQYLLKVSILISIFLIGFMINLLGTLVWVYYYHLYSWEEQQIWRYGGNRIWDQETWNPYYSPIVLDIKILAEGYVSNIQLQQFNGTGWHYVTYGLVPCSYDLYILCKLGVIPVVLVTVVIATLSVFIVGRKEANESIRFISKSILHPRYNK